MKKKILVVILLFLQVLLFSQDIPDLSPLNSGEMSERDWKIFMTGFMVGNYYSSLLANWKFGIEKSICLKIMVLDTTVSELADETASWYVRTGEYNKPFWFAIYRRNLD